MIFAGVQGLEPRLPGPKPGVLPLDDTPCLSIIQGYIYRLRARVSIVLLDVEKINSADLASASSSNNPNTAEPLPDRLANRALLASN